jgi:hypothetical protein
MRALLIGPPLVAAVPTRLKRVWDVIEHLRHKSAPVSIASVKRELALTAEENTAAKVMLASKKLPELRSMAQAQGMPQKNPKKITRRRAVTFLLRSLEHANLSETEDMIALILESKADKAAREEVEHLKQVEVQHGKNKRAREALVQRDLEAVAKKEAAEAAEAEGAAAAALDHLARAKEAEEAAATLPVIRTFLQDHGEA